MAMKITSPNFAHGAEMPRLFTAEGADVSPELTWSGVPHGARSLALIVDDPDAPDPSAPQRTYVHWVIFNMAPTASGLPEATGRDLPRGAREGLNDWNRTGYGGPAPPIGRHRYFFKLYALNTVLESLTTPTKAELEKAMEGHILEKAELIGTYQSQKR